jgi:hypothetical protein
VVSELVQTHGGRLRTLRRTALLLSSLSGLGTLVFGQMSLWGVPVGLGLGSYYDFAPYRPAWSPAATLFIFAAAGCALAGGIFTLAARAVEQSIRDAAVSIDDPEMYVRLWKEIGLPTRQSVTRSQMDDQVAEWARVPLPPKKPEKPEKPEQPQSIRFRPAHRALPPFRQFLGFPVPIRLLVRLIGLWDFVRLLRTTGADLGLLSAHWVQSGDDLEMMYRLDVGVRVESTR